MSQILRMVFGNLTQKIVALFFALFLWMVAVLDRSHEVKIEVPVVVMEKGRAERVITNVDTKSALVTVTGRGRELLRLRGQKLAFRPTVPEGRFGSRQIKLNPLDLELPGNLLVRAVEPEMIEVKLGPALKQPVQVIVPTKGKVAAGTVVSEIRVKSAVSLIGPADEVESFTRVQTESLDLGSVRANERRWLRVIPPGAGFSCVPESVEVEIILEKEEARIFLGLPVEVVAPPTLNVSVNPSEAQVAIAGPADLIDSLKPQAITVQIKISGLSPGEYRLAADVKLPERLRLVKIEPELFDITIR
ncbi:MAG: CdaR family protein [bacterium]